jgi:NAD(P)-dependent dehydrogenase (short-subunit alcohol dehydrogenase family)
VAGDRGRRGQPVYNTSKAALATFMEALRNRLGKTKVKVVTIKPGPVATPMTANIGMKNMMPASKAASLILKKSNRNGEHYLSVVHRIIFLIIRNIPSPIFRKLKI